MRLDESADNSFIINVVNKKMYVNDTSVVHERACVWIKMKVD